MTIAVVKARKDELVKVACSQCMGLHSSAGRASIANAEAMGSNTVEAMKIFAFLQDVRVSF